MVSILRFYKLTGREIAECPPDEWICAPMPHIGDTTIGNVRVSTIFLGLDHNVFGDRPPELFETMVFGGPNGCWFKGGFGP